MMSDHYTHDELTERGLAEMAYERDLQAQTARAVVLDRDLRHMTEERDTISSAWDELAAERDALAAEVERLTAELIQTRTDTLRVLDEMRAHHKAEIALVQGFAREELAALRAQLAAGEGWRTLDEPWEGRNKVQFLITDGWFNDVGAPAWAGGALIKQADAGRWVRYRPAPPQE